MTTLILGQPGENTTLYYTSVEPTDNPLEGVVDPTSFWPVKAKLDHRWQDVGPTVAKVVVGSPVAGFRGDPIWPVGGLMTSDQLHLLPPVSQRCLHRPK